MIPDRVLKLIAALLLLANLGLALFWQPVPPRHARELPAPEESPQALAAVPAGGDFSFDTQYGPFRLADHRGKVVVLYFGYTFCPDVCPTTLLAIGAALKELGAQEAARVCTVFVSVDPQRDTVTQLADYVRFFHPSIIGATGDRERIDDAVRRYGASYAIHTPKDGDRYVVDHSALTYLIDRDGKLAATLPHGAPPEHVAAAIRKLLSTPTQGAPT